METTEKLQLKDDVRDAVRGEGWMIFESGPLPDVDGENGFIIPLYNPEREVAAVIIYDPREDKDHFIHSSSVIYDETGAEPPTAASSGKPYRNWAELVNDLPMGLGRL